MLDSCRAHKDVPVLKAVKHVFLPLNITAILLLCDQEIIQCLKVQYRKGIVHKIVQFFDNTIEISVNLLDVP